MPSPSPDWLRQASDIERDGDGGVGGGGHSMMHKFGNGSDCWNTHTNESSSAAAAVMKRRKKTRARMEEEETWRSEDHRHRREEREGLHEEDEDDSDDDEEMIVGEHGEFKLAENYEMHLVDGTNREREIRRLMRKFECEHPEEEEDPEEEEEEPFTTAPPDEREREEQKQENQEPRDGRTGGAFTGAKSGVACTEVVQEVIAKLTEKTPAGVAERSKIEKQKTKQIVPNLERWKRTSAKEIEELEESCEETLRLMEQKRDLTHVWFHFDYDMFYAQAAIVDNPVLRDMPFVVGAPVCTTASYVARQFGIRSGMPTHTAMKLYKHHVNKQTRKAAKQAYLEGLRERFPDDDEERKAWETARRKELGDKRYDKAFEFEELLVTDVDFDRYAEIAKLGHEVYRKYDPDFLAPSSDEVYLNMTEYFNFDEREMTPEEKADEMEKTMKKIREEVFEKAKLTVSGGGGPSMRLAKICSDVNKPNGQKILTFTSEDILKFLNTLSIRKIGGIGASMERYLNAFDVKTCGDIITHKAKLAKVCHATAYTFLFSVAMGVGMETVPPPIQDGAPGRRGVSMNRSWYPGISKYEYLFKILESFAQGVSKEVKRLNFIPRQIMITAKFQHNFQQVTRQRRLPRASQSYKDWIPTVKDLFDKLYHEFDGDTKPLDVRRLGVRVSCFIGEELENITEDQRLNVPKAANASDLPHANQGVYFDLNNKDTYTCPECCLSVLEENRKDHELVHRMHRGERERLGAHIPSSSPRKCAKTLPSQGKNRFLKRKSNLKPVVQRADGSSKKTKKAKQVVAPIDRKQARLKK